MPLIGAALLHRMVHGYRGEMLAAFVHAWTAAVIAGSPYSQRVYSSWADTFGWTHEAYWFSLCCLMCSVHLSLLMLPRERLLRVVACCMSMVWFSLTAAKTIVDSGAITINVGVYLALVFMVYLAARDIAKGRC